MFGSEVLEIAIGLVLVYLILALVCTVVVEWIARILALRSNTLHDGITELLDADLTKRLYEHPLIKGYARKSAIPNPFNKLGDEPARPSYIPSHLFTLALFQILPPAAGTDGPIARATPGGTESPPDPQPTTVRGLEEAVVASSSDVRRTLLPLINQAGGTMPAPRARGQMAGQTPDGDGGTDGLAAVRESVEAWYDNAMDRVSGQYTRKAQLIGLLVALGLSALANADSFAIASALKRDPTLRAAAASLAEQTASDPAYQACLAATPVPAAASVTPPTSAPETPCDVSLVNRLDEEVGGLGLPLGWGEENDVDGWGDLPAKGAGLLFTGFAVSLGAPFWFDLLKRFTSIRATGKVPEPTATATTGTTETPAANG